MFSCCSKSKTTQDEPYTKEYPQTENTHSSYVPEFQEDWPPFEFTRTSGSLFTSVKKDADLGVEELKDISSKFVVEFPCDTARCASLKYNAAILTSNINSAYPIIHEYTLKIINEFLKFKNKYGSTVEQKLYKNMDVVGFVDRLLKKRSVMFVGTRDKYILLSEVSGCEGWDSVGTEEETPPLLLQDCLSYGEQKISALLSVSSYSQFINTGNRRNIGLPAENLDEVQERGIIIGLIGTRLPRTNAMECEDIIIHENQNTNENGYGPGEETTLKKYRKMWCHFYNEKQNYLFRNALELYNKNVMEGNPSRFTKLNNASLFDNIFYKKRLALSLDTLLLEANSRAKQANTTAFVHVVGIGLGVWRVASHQDQTFLDILAQRIHALFSSLHNVSDLALAYFKVDTCGGFKDNDIIPNDNHPLGGIKITFTKRDPHSRLLGSDQGKLLVVSFAWDANALPGNEYWSGSLDTSSDPAAACSSQVAELHNPQINTANINGRNLHIASRRFGVVHISDYAM